MYKRFYILGHSGNCFTIVFSNSKLAHIRSFPRCASARNERTNECVAAPKKCFARARATNERMCVKIPSQVYDRFVARATELARQLRQGPVLGKDTVDCGAMVMPAQLDIVQVGACCSAAASSALVLLLCSMLLMRLLQLLLLSFRTAIYSSLRKKSCEW